jgi:hypothetical protein
LLGCGAAGEPSAPEPRVADASTPVATPMRTATSQPAEVGMDEAAFWRLIAATRQAAAGDPTPRGPDARFARVSRRPDLANETPD